MFTGIIKHTGKLTKKEDARLTFEASQFLVRKLKIGTSIAIDGVCLTVAGKTSTIFSAEVMPETFQKTILSNLRVGDLVNLELPTTPSTFLSGHIIQGHIDDVGKIRGINGVGNSRIFTVTVPKSISLYIVEKGTVAVNGISLTVIETGNDFFTVGIIPLTWKHTMLRNAHVGDKVNIETDIIGKYVRKFII